VKAHQCDRELNWDEQPFIKTTVFWNAALNILELGLRTAGHVGTLNASGDIDKSLGEEIPLSKPSRGKRKPKE
jgi:hypothetical protein